jgi:hypothetical protein
MEVSVLFISLQSYDFTFTDSSISLHNPSVFSRRFFFPAAKTAIGLKRNYTVAPEKAKQVDKPISNDFRFDG